MGIYCEINLHKPPTGAYVGTSGSVVSGVIKYAVDKETVFTKIIVSLKGFGILCIEQNSTSSNGRPRQKIQDITRESYIDLDNVIQNDKNEIVLPANAYEIPFSFEIPCDVPPTLKYKTTTGVFFIRCNINYYVRIKFCRPGFMKFDKHYKKELTVISGIIPRLSITPITHGGQKQLTQIFTRKPSIVNIKANILNSVLKCGDKIEFTYEVTNNTNVVIKAVETKLVEVYKFYTVRRKEIDVKKAVPDTESKTISIPSGKTQEMSVEIKINSDQASAEFSKLFSRDYFVFITVYLPIPHRNYVLQIPVQISNIVQQNVEISSEGVEPPSYWEAMNEFNNDKMLNDFE